MTDWTTWTVAGMAVWRIAAFFGLLLAFMVAGKLAQFYAGQSAKALMKRHGRTAWAAAVCGALVKPAPFLFFAVGLQQALKLLALPGKVEEWATTAGSVLLTLAVGYLFFHLVDVVNRWMEQSSARTKSPMDNMLAPMVRKTLRITVVVLTLIQVAQVLSDKPMTSVLTGLGVGGLAVALAAQETLKNFFGSLAILGDKPFELGDRIVVDGFDGPVESVGFRSTRIRTLDGHLITIPNGEMANKTIQNIGKRPYIKRVANVTITYDTPLEKVGRAIEIIKDLLRDHEGMNSEFPPRVYFDKFNDASLNILVIYWYFPPDYWAFCEFNERFNLALLQRFNDEGIEFAFPTQTLYLAGDPNRPLISPGKQEGPPA